MTATNRGIRLGLADADLYNTPTWTIRRLLEALPLPGGAWLEPGAGDGNIIEAVNGIRGDVDWTAVELRSACESKLSQFLPPSKVLIRDFLTLHLDDFEGERFDVCLGNPPYIYALEFVQKSLELAEHVVLLLRQNFVSSETRFALMSRTMPDLLVLPQRPSFRGSGSDSTEYAFFHWGPKRNRTLGTIQVLGLTPKKERRCSNS